MYLVKHRLCSKGRMFGTRIGELGHRRRWDCLKSWLRTFDHFPPLCTVALALSSVNFVQTAENAAKLGWSFLLLQALLTILIGMPLCLLELGLGQFSQQGCAAVWRAVPVLRGIAFIKLASAMILGVCSGVRVAVAAAYAVQSAAAILPMSECSQLTKTEHGYYQNHTYGIECAVRTFLKPYHEDSFWFSVMCVIIFIVWIVVPVCLYSLDVGPKWSLAILASVTLVLSISLTIAIGQGDIFNILPRPDWFNLGSSEMWIASLWQVLLANRLGLGYLDTAGGILYFNCHSVRWSIAITLCNLLVSWLGLLFWSSVTSGVQRDASVLGVCLWIYDSAVHDERRRVWTSLTFALLIACTISSMITFIYPVFDGLSKTFRYQWRVPALCLLAAAMACSMVLFYDSLEVMVFLEQTLVPAVVCLVLLVEVMAFMGIYGWKNLRSDLEFMLATRLRLPWLIIWPMAALTAAGLASWRLYSMAADGWPWQSKGLAQLGLMGAMGCVVVLTVLVWAVVMIVQQEEYDIFLKVKSSFKPSRKWGPVEPILRHLWIQWSTNPHSTDLITQVQTHRTGTPLNFMDSSMPRSGSSSRKSSFEFGRRFEDYSSKKSSSDSKVSLEDYTEYRRRENDGRTSKASSGMVSMSSRMGGTPVSDFSGSHDMSSSSCRQDDVFYAQIKQMYY